MKEAGFNITTARIDRISQDYRDSLAALRAGYIVQLEELRAKGDQEAIVQLKNDIKRNA